MLGEINASSKSLVIYRRLLSHAMKHWKAFMIAIVGMVVLALAQTSFAALMKPLMDGSFVDRDPEMIAIIPVVLILIFVVRAVAMFCATYGMSLVGRNLIMELRNLMFYKLIHLPKDYYDVSTTGELISKFTFDTELVANAVTRAVTVLVSDILIIIGLVGWMFYLNAMLALTFMFVGPIIGLLVVYVSKRFRTLSLRIQHTMGTVSRVLEETIKAQIVVKVFGGHDHEMKQFDTANDTNRVQNLKMLKTTALNTPVIHLIVAVSLSGIIYMATNDEFMDAVTVGTFMSFLTAMLMLFPPIKRLTEINAVLQRGIAAGESVFSLIDRKAENDLGKYEINRASGGISYENVSFKYSTGKNDALTDVTFSIINGQTVAFIGRSGSGKSTLLNLLPRLYEHNGGIIKLDGTAIEEYTLDNLRTQISYVGQDVVLFNDTVAHNIAYGKLHNFDFKRIKEAADAAHAIEFIEQMKDGFDTVVGERGVMLSGGQRQRIAIARAILKDAPILILDEATSALDTESERYIQSSLQVLMKDRTTLVIAHRLSTIENSDLIIVLDQGRIVETGTHHELIKNDGHYSSLHKLQFSGSPA